VEAWPQGRQRYVAWFNTINEAYVKARYSKYYQISDEALAFLLERRPVILQNKEHRRIGVLNGLMDEERRLLRHTATRRSSG